MALFQAISKYFEPVAGKTRVRDVVREIPGQFSKQIGQPAFRGYGAVGTGLYDIGAGAFGKIFPSSKASLAANRPVLTPSTPFQKELYGTDKPITPSSFGAEFGLDPKGKFAAPVGFIIGSLDAIPGGKAITLEVKSILKNLNKLDDVARFLKTELKLADDLVESYAPIFTKAKTIKEVDEGLNALENILKTTKQVDNVSLEGVSRKLQPTPVQDAIAKGQTVEEYVKGQLPDSTFAGKVDKDARTKDIIGRTNTILDKNSSFDDIQKAIKDLSNKDQKISRGAYERMTGEKLPSSIGESSKALRIKAGVSDIALEEKISKFKSDRKLWMAGSPPIKSIANQVKKYNTSLETFKRNFTNEAQIKELSDKGISVDDFYNILTDDYSSYYKDFQTASQLRAEFQAAKGTGSAKEAIAKGLTEEQFVSSQKLTQTLRGTKGLSADDIQKQHPNIRLTKDVVAKDVYGNPVKIPEGEKLTPYEMKGNKVLLQDGQAYVVSKNQFANIKGQSVGGEAKPFAPELDGIEETVRIDVKIDKSYKGWNDFTDKMQRKYGTDSPSSTLSKLTSQERVTWDSLKTESANLERGIGKDNAPTKFSSYQLPDGKNYKEVLIKAPNRDSLPYIHTSKDGAVKTFPNRQEAFDYYNNLPIRESLGTRIEPKQAIQDFKSSHWDEPNVISHLRLNERTYQGKKVTFMEELQSDWAREARKEGSTVPKNEMLKNWQELSVKRALKEAVDNNSEYFAWINGEQTSARYSLATRVENVEWGNGNLKIKPISNDRNVVKLRFDKEGAIRDGGGENIPAEWKGKKLDEVLGKGLADKIMEKESGKLSGDGLKFGGEWANTLYDKQVGNIVKDLTGAKVEFLDMGLPIEKVKSEWWTNIKNQEQNYNKLTTKDLKIGADVRKDFSDYIITDVLGDGKFKAVPKDVMKRYEMNPEQFIDPRTNKAETFDISTKTTTQQGIRLTPEIKAKIRGEALDIKTSGKQFEDNTAQLRAEYADELAKVARGDISKERKFINTVRESPRTAPEIASTIEGRYTPITNAETLAKAQEIVRVSPDEAFRIARSSEPPTALGNTVSQLLVDDLQRQAIAIKSTNAALSRKLFDEAIDIVENVARRATTQGQAIQSLSIWNKLSPEGILLQTEKIIQKANKLLPDKKQLKLTAEKADDIITKVKKIQQLPEGREKIIETAVLQKEIYDLLPVSIARKISAMQTIAQLLNPKTIIRNIVGNTGFAIAEQISDVVGTVLDTPLSLITGKRTKTLPSIGRQVSAGIKGFREGLKEALKGVDVIGVGTQFDLPRTAVFKGTVGKGAERLLNVVLRAPDRAFFQAAYEGSLYQQMKAAGVKVPTEEMKEIAFHDGLYRTFQDENATTRAFQGIKKSLNSLSSTFTGTTEFGLGDIVLKYPKTPANLLNRGLAYTPAGFMTSVIELAKPLAGKPFNQKKFVEASARALTGSTALFGIGATLHKLGIVTTERNKDSDIANLDEQVGLGQYRINASALKRFVFGGFDPDLTKPERGDNIWSYDWFQPNAIAIGMGADFDKNKGVTTSMFGTLATGVSSGIDTLAEQPLITGVSNLFKYQSLSTAFQKALERLPSSFIPTLLNQVRQLVDPKSRNPLDANPLKYSLNLAKNRIPYLSEGLPPNVTTFGEDKKIYQTTNSLFNVFFNPAFVSKYNPTPEAQLVLDLYNQTGDGTGAPRVVSKKQNINGEYKQLTSTQIEALQRYTGSAAREIFASFAADPQFTALPVEDKINELQNTLTAIGAAGKIWVLGDRPKKNPSKKTLQVLQLFSDQ